MVRQTFTSSKNTNSVDNLTSSTSLPPQPPPPAPPPPPSSSLSTSQAPIVPVVSNHTQHKSPSNEQAKSPPPFHQPSSSSSSSRSYPHNTDSNTSNYTTVRNDLPFSMTPAGRFFTHFFDEAMQYFNYPMHNIVWTEEPPTTNAYCGNSINEKIINNDEKFSIEIDLSDFLAGELQINYDEEERELLVEGHQKERSDRHGSIERNFKRKFDLPFDAHDGSLAAYLLPSGSLTIQAFKKGIKQPLRRIPIQEVVDIPDVPHTNKNPSNAPTSDATTTNIAPQQTSVNTGPPVPPKPKNVSELKSANFAKMSETVEETPQIQNAEKNTMEQLNFDETQKSTNKPAVKREYLNIFC